MTQTANSGVILFAIDAAGNYVTDSNGNPAGSVVVADTELDIQTYDHTGQNIAVIAGVPVPGIAVAAGVKKVLVTWMAGADRDICHLRWGASPTTNADTQLNDRDSLILRVPDTGDRKLYVIGETGTAAGSAVHLQPLG